MTVPDHGQTNICQHCDTRIYLDKWEVWRHFASGLILCQPDEDADDFTGTEGASPMIDWNDWTDQ